MSGAVERRVKGNRLVKLRNRWSEFWGASRKLDQVSVKVEMFTNGLLT